MNNNLTALGKFVAILRIHKGVSQKDMALAIGIAPSYTSCIELGKREVPEAYFIRSY